MIIMKKLTAIFLCFAMALSLAACGNSSSNETSAPETDSDATQSSSNTMEQETVSPNSDSNILIAYFTMPEDVDDN